MDVFRVDFDVVGTIEEAARGIDALFAAGTFHEAGPSGDRRHGRNIVDAAEAAGVAHVVYVSVAGADRRTDVPLFESKRQVEEYLSQSSLPFTIIAPVYFMENLWNQWNLPVLAAGRFPSPIPAARKLQQIPLGNVIDFAAYVLGRRDEFIGRRVEIASDELSALEAVEVVADLTGRRLEVDTHVNGGPLPLFWWLDRVGYAIELNDLRERFPDIHWRRFRAWAQTQDWSLVTPATA